MYDLPIKSGEFTQEIPVAAGEKIEAGGIFALDSVNGHAISDPNTANATVMGRAESEADNTNGANGDVTVVGRRGAFVMQNAAFSAVGNSDVGKDVDILAPDTVVQAGSSNNVRAGKLLGFNEDGLPVVEIR